MEQYDLQALVYDWQKYLDTGIGTKFSFGNFSREYSKRFTLASASKYTDVQFLLVPPPNADEQSEKEKEGEGEQVVVRSAHRCILWARSQHFRAMFSSGFVEGLAVVVLCAFCADANY